jgi:uncharacterized protein
MRKNDMTEIAQMVLMDHLDIRAVTMGINLLDCATETSQRTAEKVKAKIKEKAQDLISQAQDIQNVFGIPIKNKRISVTPIGLLANSCKDREYYRIAIAMDEAVKELNDVLDNDDDKKTKGITFIGGYSALVHKGYTDSDGAFVNSIVEALDRTKHVCSSMNVASTKTGINMEAVRQVASMVKKLGAKTDKGHGCAKFVVFANAPEDNPFMAGAFHGIGEPECVINIGISGPSVIRRVVEASRDVDFGTLSDRIKRAIFKVVRAGELVGRKLATALGIEFGIVDLSLAPTPDVPERGIHNNSIARIIEAMGIEKCGTHGTTVALALLIDAVKKGGVAATSSVGGLSGAFIPISEDTGMVDAVTHHALSLDKLESLTSICSVGLDMVGIPGDTPETTIASIIADEMAIGVINNKTTAVRILPIPGAAPGQIISLKEYNDLLGDVIIMDVNKYSSEEFWRVNPGRVPAPIRSLTN